MKTRALRASMKARSDSDSIGVQPADPATRRRAFLLLGAALVLGFALIPFGDRIAVAMQAWIGSHMTGQPEEDLRRLGWVFYGVLGAMALFPVLSGMRVATIGREIVRTERYPPPGRPVIVNTPIRTGPPARRRGQILVALGALLVACGIGLLVVGHALIRSAAS